MNKPISLLEFAYNGIREGILAGQYAPGSKLVAGIIAREFGISQTPVKEALNQLVAEGLVECLPRRGHMVHRISKNDICDMINVRIMMECFAIERAVENVQKYPDAILRMEEILAQYDIMETLSYTAASKLEQEFHSLFIGLAENTRLARLYRTDWSIALIYYVYSIAKYPLALLKDEFDMHRSMYEKLISGDAKMLEYLICKNLNQVMSRLLTIINSDKTGIFTE